MVNYPKDWKQDKIIDVADIFDNLRIPVAESIRVKGNTPYYGANGIQGYIKGYTHDGEFVLIAEDGASSLLDYPITFTRGKIWVNNHAHVLSGKDKILDNEYLAYALKKVNYEKIIVGGTRIKLNGSTLKAINLQYPKYTEQRKIALALNSFDTHIKNLSKLIEKKKMIRDGAVEELLSGYKRMKKNKPWKEFKLEEVCVPRGMVRGPFGGSLKKDAFIYKGYKVYEQKNAIYKSINLGDYYIDENKYDELSRFSVKENDFIVSCSGTIGEIYRIPHNYVPGVINQALLKLTIDDNICDFNLFNHYFNWNKFKHKIIDDTQGGAMKNLVGMDKFRKTTIYIPTDTEEQKIIAEILSSMDKEIENLEKEKEKYQQLKSGTMDDLLTGKIRLV